MADKFLEQLNESQGFDGLWVYGVQYGQDVKIRGSSIGGGGAATPVQARTVYAGPAAGNPAVPTFRMLSASDIPDLSGLYITANGAELTSPKINNPVIAGGSISGVTAVFDDNKFTLRNASDTTKQIGFDLSAVTAGNKRTISLEDGNYTLVGTTLSQTLSNKKVFISQAEPAGASFKMAPGPAPAVPINGDLWMQTDGLYYRSGGTTIGPLNTGGSSVTGVTTFNTRTGDVTLSSTDISTALGYTPLSPSADRVSRFNNRTGVVTLTSTDVVNALGYTPAASGGGSAGVSSFNTRTGAVTLTSGDVTTALGYTPFSSNGGTVAGTVTAAGLSVTGNAVWHAGNFNPATKANLNADVTFNAVTGTSFVLPTGSIAREAADIAITVGGTKRFIFGADGRFTATGGGIGCVGDMAVNGNIVASGDITGLSDSRLKTHVSTVHDALEMVDNMRGVWYTMGDKDRVGVIAQEMEKILPEVVVTGDDGYKSVAYGNIVGVLIEAIKELKREVDRLKER